MRLCDSFGRIEKIVAEVGSPPLKTAASLGLTRDPAPWKGWPFAVAEEPAGFRQSALLLSGSRWVALVNQFLLRRVDDLEAFDLDSFIKCGILFSTKYLGLAFKFEKGGLSVVSCSK